MMHELLNWFRGGSLHPGADWQVERRGDCAIYDGHFAIYTPDGTMRRMIRGRVVEWPRRSTDVYLAEVPPELRRHRHGPCLQLLEPGSDWFKLHWERPARDFEASRAYVEELLDEVF